MPLAPTSPPPGSVGFLLSQVGRSVARGFRSCLEPLGLEPRQYLLLRAVGACQDQSQHAVGTSLQIPPNRMVVLVDNLEGRGLLERVPNPSDRRAHALRLTTGGRRLLLRAVPLAEAYEAEVCRPLGEDGRAALLALLGRMAGARGLPVVATSTTARAEGGGHPPWPVAQL
jgi:DNA-binding MarR family transcriptional regulator